MSIQVKCGGCGKRFSAPDDWAGRRAKCSKCGAELSIPTPLVDLQPADPMADLFDEEFGGGPNVADPTADPFATMPGGEASSPLGHVPRGRRGRQYRSHGNGFAAWLLSRTLSLAVAVASCIAFLILALFGAVTAGLVVGGIGILIAVTGLSSYLAKVGVRSRPKPVNMRLFWGQVWMYLMGAVTFSYWSSRNFQHPELRIVLVVFCMSLAVGFPCMGLWGGMAMRRFGAFRVAAWTYLGLFVPFLCVAFCVSLGTLADDRASQSAEADVEEERDTGGSTSAGREVESRRKPGLKPGGRAGSTDRPAASAERGLRPKPRASGPPGFPEMGGGGMGIPPRFGGPHGLRDPPAMPRPGAMRSGGTSRFSDVMDTARQKLIDRFGADRAVTVTVHNVSFESLTQLVESARAAAGGSTAVTNHSNSLATITIAPVDDVKGFAAKLKIGKVTKVDPGQRTITVDAEAGP